VSSTVTIDAETKAIAKIVDTITQYLSPKRIFLFGSRARRQAGQYSDFDIAVEDVDMGIRIERKLKEALDIELGIYTVDLINLDKVDPKFKALILQQGKVIYER